MQKTHANDCVALEIFFYLYGRIFEQRVAVVRIMKHP